jgi:CDP-4-dehydro-6-deoxyglucose reductase/ferredoxin-NAD(P)+ reductase (naphthalene dioxygenase ferredoxin-specific)
MTGNPLRRLACRVAALDALTHDTRRIALVVEHGGPFVFAAGQYVKLSFGDLPPRDYSMANCPDDPVLQFFIRRMGAGAASAHAVERLRLGDPVTVEGPYGESWLRDRHRGPILAIAGGSGLAPIKSIVETALSLGLRQPIHLYFGVADERDLFLEDRFRALAAAHSNFRFVPVLSASARPTSRRAGPVHAAVAADFARFEGAKAYLAGPPPMVEAAMALLRQRGMAEADIHADPFYSETENAARGVAPDRQ